MLKLHETTRAIIAHEREEFGTELSLSEIKELNNLVEGNLDTCGYTYIEPDCTTKFTYVALRQDEIDDLWSESLIELFDDCYAHGIPEHLRKYIDYDSFVDDCMEDGRPHHFNGCDGRTEIESDNYYIYYHNQNYK